MTTPQIEAFRASLHRCLAQPGFMKDFYDRFIGASDEIRDKFRNTDFERQNRVVADSLFLMATAAQSAPEAIAWREMKHLARRHKELGIVPWMYDSWLDCLLEAMRAHDPQTSPEIEAAWRETLQPGIEFMRSRV